MKRKPLFYKYPPNGASVWIYDKNGKRYRAWWNETKKCWYLTINLGTNNKDSDPWHPSPIGFEVAKWQEIKNLPLRKQLQEWKKRIEE